MNAATLKKLEEVRIQLEEDLTEAAPKDLVPRLQALIKSLESHAKKRDATDDLGYATGLRWAKEALQDILAGKKTRALP